MYSILASKIFQFNFQVHKVSKVCVKSAAVSIFACYVYTKLNDNKFRVDCNLDSNQCIYVK